MYPSYPAGGALFGFAVGVRVGRLWGGCNWGGNDVNIDIDRYNNFNRSNIGGDSNWRHNVDHRKGVAYRDQATARQYNRDFNRDAETREQFRGRGDGGRQATQRGDVGGSSRGLDRAGSARDGTSTGTMDRGGASGDFSGGRSSGFEEWATAPARATSAAVAMRAYRAWERALREPSRAGAEAVAAAAEEDDEAERMAQARDQGGRRPDPAGVSIPDRLARRNGRDSAEDVPRSPEDAVAAMVGALRNGPLSVVTTIVGSGSGRLAGSPATRLPIALLPRGSSRLDDAKHKIRH